MIWFVEKIQNNIKSVNNSSQFRALFNCVSVLEGCCSYFDFNISLTFITTLFF